MGESERTADARGREKEEQRGARRRCSSRGKGCLLRRRCSVDDPSWRGRESLDPRRWSNFDPSCDGDSSTEVSWVEMREEEGVEEGVEGGL